MLRRRALRLCLWTLANDLIATGNHLSCGRVGHKHTRAQRREKLAVAFPCVAAPCSDVDDDHVSQSHARFHQLTHREAIRLRTARREALSNKVPLTGVQCVVKLIKANVVNRYSVRTRVHAQEPMRALDVDEPPRGSAVVGMLEALPPKEREFYAHEDNVIDWCGRMSKLFYDVLGAIFFRMRRLQGVRGLLRA